MVLPCRRHRGDVACIGTLISTNETLELQLTLHITWKIDVLKRLSVGLMDKLLAVRRHASLGLPNVSMRNSALVGWWWGCGRSLAALEVPLLNFLLLDLFGHSVQSMRWHSILMCWIFGFHVFADAFQFGNCLDLRSFDFMLLVISFQQLAWHASF